MESYYSKCIFVKKLCQIVTFNIYMIHNLRFVQVITVFPEYGHNLIRDFANELHNRNVSVDSLNQRLYS